MNTATLQRASGRDAPRYETARDVAKICPEPAQVSKPRRGSTSDVSLDALIEDRMAGYVGPIVEPLQAEIEDLNARLAQLGQLAPELPAALDRHQIAFHLSCSPSTADMLIRTGRMEAVQLPGMAARVVRREEFLRFLASAE